MLHVGSVVIFDFLSTLSLLIFVIFNNSMSSFYQNGFHHRPDTMGNKFYSNLRVTEFILGTTEKGNPVVDCLVSYVLSVECKTCMHYFPPFPKLPIVI